MQFSNGLETDLVGIETKTTRPREVTLNGKVHVLGVEYSIIKKNYDDDPAFSENSWDGYVDYAQKTIVYCNMKTYPDWDKKPDSVILIWEKQTLRHEITHAFLEESGLSDSSLRYSAGWAKNEEMVDWIAIQFPKMLSAFQEADCL